MSGGDRLDRDGDGGSIRNVQSRELGHSAWGECGFADAWRATIATHVIEPVRETLHGHFSRDLPPVLTINSGETVRFRLLDARWGGDRPEAEGGGEYLFEPRLPELDNGHALCGPIEIRGAEPGMTLEVEIGDLRTGSFGWTVAGGWASPLNTRLGLLTAPSDAS